MKPQISRRDALRAAGSLPLLLAAEAAGAAGPQERDSTPMPDVIVNGPEGRLEARYHHVDDQAAPIALMLHPHPQHGGTMHNKVVYNLFHCFVRRGFSVMRFNFRGVGRSQGEYGRGEGELADAAAILDHMQSLRKDPVKVWIAGFSFGAWIGMQLLMRRPEISGFIFVAPPANMYDFTFLAPCPSSGLIVNGTRDEIVTTDSVEKLVEKLRTQCGIVIDHKVIPGANHFFTRHLEQLNGAVEAYLDRRLAADKR